MFICCLVMKLWLTNTPYLIVHLFSALCLVSAPFWIPWNMHPGSFQRSLLLVLFFVGVSVAGVSASRVAFDFLECYNLELLFAILEVSSRSSQRYWRHTYLASRVLAALYLQISQFLRYSFIVHSIGRGTQVREWERERRNYRQRSK